MEKCQWDKYQSGNEQIASVLVLEAKHGLFGCQANLKMLSTVAKVHEKCSKLFPRVLGSLNCSNPSVPERLSQRRGLFGPSPQKKQVWECICLPAGLYLQTFIFLVITLLEMVSHRVGASAEGKEAKLLSCWPLCREQLPRWWCGRCKAGTRKPVSTQRRFRKISP